MLKVNLEENLNFRVEKALFDVVVLVDFACFVYDLKVALRPDILHASQLLVQ